jgi:hypothetical protein
MKLQRINRKIFAVVRIAVIAGYCAKPVEAQDFSLVALEDTVLPGGQTQEISLMFGTLQGSRHDDLTLSYGRFGSPRIQVGGTVGLGEGGLSAITTAGVFADYHFGPGRTAGRALVPYAGIFGGYASPDGRRGVALGVHGGVKFFPINALAVRGEVQHRRGLNRGSDNNIVIGLSAFLR